VSIDTGVQLEGYFGDSALTVGVGELSEQTKKLLKVTEESLELAIDKVREGNRLFDICGTVERHVVDNGFRSSGNMWATGSGRSCTKSRRFRITWISGTRIRACARYGARHRADGECRQAEAKVLKDKWTAVAKDGSYSAHFEHCVAVTANGPWV